MRATLLAGLCLAAAAPAAQAGFGIAKFEAGTCNGTAAQVKSCEYVSPHSAFFTQAAGHPPWGLTGFEMNHTSGLVKVPEGGQLKRIRVDVPPGLAADPQTLGTCSRAQFESNPKGCPPDSEAGFVEMEADAEILGSPVATPAMTGTVYNLDQEPGLPLLFGITVAPAEPLVSPVNLLLEGHVSDAHEAALAARGVPSGDYHEYFEINNVPREAEVVGSAKAPLKVLKSKLFFNGQAGHGNFLTLPSVCGAPPTSYLEVESWDGEVASTPTVPPVGIEGCENVPFEPTTKIVPETSQRDTPDGGVTEVLAPQKEEADEINTADIKDATVTLPEGLTLNPSAAHGLEACPAQDMHFGTKEPVTCPAGSKIGSVTIETDLPPGSLAGSVYLGAPNGTPITGQPFTIYLDAESVYGPSVRLQGQASVDESSGRVSVTFKDNPQLPFSDLILHLEGGPRAPLANPLACGNASVASNFSPYTGTPNHLATTPFATTGCASPLPFALAQGTSTSSKQAGAYTAFTFTLSRNDGEQYLGKLSTILPPGLVGAIPSVPLCGEAQAQTGTCPSSSVIGTATVLAGAGSEPYEFKGPVWLTGPYGGSPYGLSVAVPAVAGPFDFGTVVTRVGIGVDPYSGRVIASSTLPTIVKGVPLRLRSLSVLVNRGNFLFNPTNCGALATESTLTSTFAALGRSTSPFQVSNCSALAFKPSFDVATSMHYTKANGASLQVTLTQGPHEANIHSVVASLPPQLPSRLSTIQKACPEATFAANPFACASSKVGAATVRTPVLPTPLTGPAYLVSHGGAAFPDLDVILEGSGVRVILVGNVNIKNGITTSTFASVPDVPVSSFSLSLPTGPNSALGGFGSLCAKPLLMPTTITAQSGAQIKQNTRIAVAGCGVTILSRRIKGHTLILRVRTRSAGRVVAAGRDLRTRSARTRRSATVTLKMPLTKAGVRSLHRHRHRPLRLRVTVSFTPATNAEAANSATTAVAFKR